MRMPFDDELRAWVILQNVSGHTIQSGERVDLDNAALVTYTDAQDKVILMRRGIFVKASEDVLHGHFGRFEVEMD